MLIVVHRLGGVPSHQLHLMSKGADCRRGRAKTMRILPFSSPTP